MKYIYIGFSLQISLCLIVNFSFAQSPQVLRSDLQIKPYFKFENTDLQTRIVYDQSDKTFYTIAWNGDLFHLVPHADGTFRNDRLASAADHAINYLQGLAIKDGFVYLVGNVVIQQGVSGYGKAVKAKINSAGSLVWTDIFQTAEHASSRTLFDHAFSAICFSPDGQDMYIASGSRTDHGEVKDNEGRYPNLREIALTSLIFKIPASTENLKLPNDSATIAPYVYVRGVRNAFSLAFSPAGDLFSVENSGDRDDPEEMNWIHAGAHYGFPWEMGGNDTPMQFSGYDPEKDKLINHQYTGYKIGAFHDDKSYPQKPKTLTYRKPIQNLGPDADKFRDNVSSTIVDASDAGRSISTFTGHRSPVGLSFDTQFGLGGEYTKMGFVLSYQQGSASYGPMEDPGQDLLMLNLKKNNAGDEYQLNAYKIAAGFGGPTDSEIVDNKLYVLEEHGQIWEITFPKETVTGIPGMEPVIFKTYPNPTKGKLIAEWPDRQGSVTISVMDLSGRTLSSTTKDAGEVKSELDLSHLQSGMYIVRLTSQSNNISKKILINP